MQESKEKIRSRMIRNASRLWGYPDTEAESSFDPMVGMLIGALAGELSKISGEIQSTEARLVEKLVQLLTPEPMTGALPAHGLVTALPSEPIYTITPDFQFYLKKMFLAPGKNFPEEKPVFFTPAGYYRLYDGKVKNLAAGSKIFAFTEENYKEIVAHTAMKKNLPPGEIWFALEMNEDIESLKGLSVCFDLRNEVYKEAFYRSMARGKWTVNGNQVVVKQGFGDDIRENTEQAWLHNYDPDITTKICDHVNHYYSGQFFTFTQGQLTLRSGKESGTVPQELSDYFYQRETDPLQRGMVWIKVECPLILPAEVMDDLFCSINSFPVINRRLTGFSHSSGNFISIIPLFTEEIFLDIKKVCGSRGSIYMAKTLTGSGEFDKGTYIIRQGGVARFDSRNASEILQYLMELLRDEMAAFSVIGTDMIASNLKELNQTIARLEQRLTDNQITREEVSYLMLKPFAGDDILFIEFWSTTGALANKIKSGEMLTAYEGSDLQPGSISFITPTAGGKEKMNTEQRVNAYRKALLSHGRIVTPEDIKTLCYDHFGSMLKSVEVKKGIQEGLDTRSGFIQTLDIMLTFNKSLSEWDKEELSFMKKDLLVKLEEQSAGILPYRVIVIN
jgi:hypothetical protein